MNRRRFLGAGLASAAGACGMLPKESAVAPPRIALADVRRLVVERADPIAGRCRYVADLGERQVAQPILSARRGESFDGVIENALPQPTTVHFHGLTLPEAADGAGFDPIAPGERKRVRFQVRNRSGLYWFHPHPHGFTAEQVYAGLTGLLVVTDDDDDALDAALALAPGNRLALAPVSLEFAPRHHTRGAAPRHRHPARERYAPLAAETVCERASGGAAEDRLADGAELALFALRVDGAPARAGSSPPSRLS